MDGFIQDLPLIIETAAKSPLGILSLAITALSIIAFYFFKNEDWKIKLPVFILLYSGVSAIGYAVIQNIPEENIGDNSVQEEAIPPPTNDTQSSSAEDNTEKEVALEFAPKASTSKIIEDKLKNRWNSKYGNKWEE